MKLRLFLFCFLLSKFACAHELDKIGSKAWFTWSGQIGQEIQFLPNTSSPLMMISTASLQTSILGIQLPFQFRFASGTFQGSHPFNGIRFAPSYKWIRLQTGICNVEQDQYGLKGVPFKGAALQLSPGKIKTQVFYGILNTHENFFEAENFLRKKTLGWSFENQWKKFHLRTNVLSVWTENENENTFLPGTQHHNGIVWSLEARTEINKSLNLRLHQAYSLFAALKGNEKNLPYYALTRLNSSNHSHAGNYSLDYKRKQHQFSLQYQYTPFDFYQAGFSVPSFNLKKIAVAYTVQKKNLRINLKSGIEDEIHSDKGIGNTKKIAASIHVNYSAVKWTAMGAYDNFTSLSRFNPIADDQWEIPQDSLIVFTVRQNASLQFRYAEKGKKFAFHAGAQFNDASQSRSFDQSFQFRPTLRANTGINYKIPRGKSSLQSSIIWIKNLDEEEIGPSMQFNTDKGKLKFSLQTQARFETRTWSFDHLQNRIQLNFAFDPKSKIKDKFHCSLMLAHRMKQQLNDFQLMFRLNYQFQ